MALTTKAKLFLDDIITFGFDEARNRSKYSRNQVYLLLKSDQARKYMSEKLSQALKLQGLSYNDIIDRIIAIAEDRKCGLTLKYRIYNDLKQTIEGDRVPGGKPDVTKLPDNKPLARLLPSKEIDIEDIQVTDNKEDSPDKKAM